MLKPIPISLIYENEYYLFNTTNATLKNLLSFSLSSNKAIFMHNLKYEFKQITQYFLLKLVKAQTYSIYLIDYKDLMNNELNNKIYIIDFDFSVFNGYSFLVDFSLKVVKQELFIIYSFLSTIFKTKKFHFKEKLNHIAFMTHHKALTKLKQPHFNFKEFKAHNIDLIKCNYHLVYDEKSFHFIFDYVFSISLNYKANKNKLIHALIDLDKVATNYLSVINHTLSAKYLSISDIDLMDFKHFLINKTTIFYHKKEAK